MLQFLKKLLPKKKAKDLALEHSSRPVRGALTRRSFFPATGGGGFGLPNPDSVPLSTYSRMRHDAQLAAGLAVIKLPVLAAEWSLEGGEDEVQDFVHRELGGNYRGLLRSMLTAVDYGFAPLELVWALGDDGSIHLVEARDPDPITVTIITAEDGDYDGFRQHETDVPAEKTLLFTHRLEHGNFYGISRLRPAYSLWRVRELIYTFCNRYYERRGNPATLVRYPPSHNLNLEGKLTSDPMLSYALKAGEELLENAVIAMPSSRDDDGNPLWEVDYLQDDARGSMFINYIEHLNTMLLRALFVPERTLTQQGEAGSYALARAHLDIFLLSEDGLIADIEDHINLHLIPKMVVYNFGFGTDSPRLRITRLSRESKELLGEVFMDMVRSGKAVPSAKLLADELGIPLAE